MSLSTSALRRPISTYNKGPMKNSGFGNSQAFERLSRTGIGLSFEAECRPSLTVSSGYIFTTKPRARLHAFGPSIRDSLTVRLAM